MMWQERRLSDSGVAARVLSGSSEDFGILVERHFPVALAVASAWLGNRRDADLIVQKAFQSAYESLHTLREPSEFCRWLVGMVRNGAKRVAEVRRFQAYTQVARGSHAGIAPDATHNEVGEPLHQRILEMAPEKREILLLHYYADKPARDIANLLGIPREAAKRTIDLARHTVDERQITELQSAMGPSVPPDEYVSSILDGIQVNPVYPRAVPAPQMSTTASRGTRLKLVVSVGVFVLFLAAVFGLRAARDSAGEGVAAPEDAPVAVVASTVDATPPPAAIATESTGTTQEALSPKDANDVLDAYARNMDKIKGITVTCFRERDGQFRWDITGPEKHRLHSFIERTFSHDFVRTRWFSSSILWGDANLDNMGVPREKAWFESRLWDGQQEFRHYRSYPPDPGKGWMCDTVSYARLHPSAFPCGFEGAPLLGYPLPRPIRLERLMRTGNIALRADRETVGIFSCYVVDAMTPQYGRIAAWFDPDRGYGLVKSEFTLGPGSLFGANDVPLEAEGTLTFTTTASQLTQVDGVWLPCSAESRYIRHSIRGQFGNDVDKLEFRSIEVNPDFEGRKTFQFPWKDVRPGAKWRYDWTEYTKDSLRYVWTGDRLVDDADPDD